MTKQELEILKNLSKKMAERRKTYEKKKLFKCVLEVLDQVPEVRGHWVQRTANDYFGRSWEQGLKVSYEKNGKWELIKHKAIVHYEHIFPGSWWEEDTDKSIAEQLFDLYVSGVINIKTLIRFEFVDWEDKTYNRSKKIVVPFGKILPEILKVVQKGLPSNEDMESEIEVAT